MLGFVRVYSSGASTAEGTDSLEKLSWDKMPLVPVSAEVISGQKWALKPLSFVKKKGSYGSVDEHLDTYYTLSREDFFAPLRKGLADFKANKLDHRDMTVRTGGQVRGFHFSRRNPGITFATTAQRVGSKGPVQLSMPGTLLCISDGGGNFESSTWGVVARCEEDKKSHVIVVELVDRKAGDGGLSTECMSRILGSSALFLLKSNILQGV